MPSKSTTTSKRTTVVKLPTPKSVSVNVALPVEVHRRLRIKAIEQNLQLKDALTEAIECWVS